MNGKQMTAPLKSWEAPATHAGKMLFPEIADVNHCARAKRNGTALEDHVWQRYRWEVTDVGKAGSHEPDVEVCTPQAVAAAATVARRGHSAVPAASRLTGPARLPVRRYRGSRRPGAGRGSA